MLPADPDLEVEERRDRGHGLTCARRACAGSCCENIRPTLLSFEEGCRRLKSPLDTYIHAFVWS
jgi:hypothetical protein